MPWGWGRRAGGRCEGPQAAARAAAARRGCPPNTVFLLIACPACPCLQPLPHSREHLVHARRDELLGLAVVQLQPHQVVLAAAARAKRGPGNKGGEAGLKRRLLPGKAEQAGRVAAAAALARQGLPQRRQCSHSRAQSLLNPVPPPRPPGPAHRLPNRQSGFTTSFVCVIQGLAAAQRAARGW